MSARNRRQNSYYRRATAMGLHSHFSGAAAADEHRTEATPCTYYPFTRIFIRILCFPFGPFKYTYRMPCIHLCDADTAFNDAIEHVNGERTVRT